MANYTELKVKGRNISDILQDADNRSNSTAYFNGFNLGTKIDDNFSKLKFALYNSLYHPFRINTGISDYFSNEYDGAVNKNYAANGCAPILINQNSLSHSDHGVTVVYKFTGTGNPLDKGTLTKVVNGAEYSLNNCPTHIVAAIIGAGGGGAGGGGWWTGKRAYGGGCGPLLILCLEMPYNQTTPTEILKVELGAGGAGGGAWSTGSAGGQTKVYFKQNNSWTLIATLDGGAPGQNTPYSIVEADSQELAITTLQFNAPINTSVLNNGDGYGKITVNESCRKFSWGSGTYAYMPGNYYGVGIDDSYWQPRKTSPRITVGNTSNLSYLYYNGSYNYGYGERGSAFATNRMYYGKTSLFGQGGAYASQGTGNGSNGVWGSGGGGGGMATSLFDSGIGSGGRGGAAGIKLYW